MKNICVSGLVMIALVGCFLAPQATAQSHRYLGQEPPSTTPEIFAPGHISLPDIYEYASVFSADGLEFFFGVNVGPVAEIRSMRWDGEAWSEPRLVIGDSRYTFGDPFLSPDEQRLYFISNRPLLDEEVEPKDFDIWYIERQSEGWGEPINLGESINSKGHEYYISFSAEGRIYFASNRHSGERKRDFDFFSADPKGDGFGEARVLAGEINTPNYEADAFVSPDESYLLFGSARREGLGHGDLYISFRQADGSWSAGHPLPKGINTEGHELCPFVTADGRYFFYTSRKDIYWVDAKVLDQVKQAAD